MREFETKLVAGSAYATPGLDGIVAGALAQDVSEQRLHTVYWDTEDLRLTRAGASLRYRRVDDAPGSWQVKLPLGSGDGSLERLELDVPGDPGRPPPAARVRVAPVVRDARLRRALRLGTRRRRVLVTRPDGVVAEVSDDQVAVYDGTRIVERFRELEVERGPAGSAEDQEVLAQALIAAGAQRGPQRSKLARVTGVDTVAATPAARDDSVDGDRPVTQVVAQTLQADLERMLAHDLGARTGSDPEDIHQMRVATRRMRSTLRTLRPLLDDEWAAGLRAELKTVADALGDVRDLDVLAMQAAADKAHLDPQAAGALDAFIDDLCARRARAHTALVAVLDSPDYVALVDDLVAAAAQPAVRAPDQPAANALAPVVRKAWKKVVKAGKGDTDLHQVRIRAKRLRYLAEAAQPVYGKKATRLAELAESVQDTLGVHHDAYVLDEVVRSRLGPDVGADQAFGLGHLVAAAHERRDQAERDWRRDYARLSTPKRVRFLK